LVDNGIATDAETGKVIGYVSHAKTLTNGTLDFTARVEKRDTELSHDFAIVCHDRVLTGLCQAFDHRYSCDASGRVTHKGIAEKACESLCQCINILPRPILTIPCYAAYQLPNIQKCSIIDDSIYDTNGTAVDNLIDATFLPNGTLQYTTAPVEKRSTALVEKRDSLAHDFAIVCYQSKITTKFCTSDPYKYTCSSSGKVTFKGRYHEVCAEYCACVNLSPAPACIITPYVVVGCHIVEDTIYDANGTVLGSSSDAVIYPNGTYEVTKLVARNRKVADKLETAPLLIPSTVPSLPALAATSTSSSLGRLSALPEMVARDANKAAKMSIPVVTKVSAVPTTTPSNTLDFSAPTQLPQEDAALSSRSEPELTPQSLAADSRFDVQCATHGKYNQSLTNHCMSEKYTCLRIATYPLAMLHHTGTPDPDCAAKCKCPNTFPKDDAPTEAVNLVPTAVNLDGSLACFTKGKANETLTSYCSDNGYTCLDLAGGTFLDTMYHTGSSIKSCDKNCQCPQPLRRRSLSHKPSASMNAVLPESTAETSPTDSLQPVQFECWSKNKYNDTLTQHCWDNDYGCQELVPNTWLYTLKHWGTEIPACTHGCRCPNLTRRIGRPSVHPKPFYPARGSAVQPSDQYKLSCGNLPDGPKLCSGADLGYFCTANMTVARNTTVHNNDSNWCDASCNCIFAGTVPCINDWGIPRCQELLDGTVRDADNMQIVLAYTGNVAVLPNGTLLIEKPQGGFFPFVASESGFLHDGNGTSVLFNASANWNHTGSV
jgi:hypothetical protein